MLKTLFKMIFWWFRGTIIYCPFCKSPETTHHDLNETIGPEAALCDWKITCKTCGASGRIGETWYRKTQAQKGRAGCKHEDAEGFCTHPEVSFDGVRQPCVKGPCPYE